MASPLILMFDGLHHGLYQLFLATKYLLSMAFIVVRIGTHFIIFNLKLFIFVFKCNEIFIPFEKRCKVIWPIQSYFKVKNLCLSVCVLKNLANRWTDMVLLSLKGLYLFWGRIPRNLDKSFLKFGIYLFVCAICFIKHWPKQRLAFNLCVEVYCMMFACMN